MLSRRCVQRQHLLRPEAEVNEIILYAIAISAKRYDIGVHAWVAMSNHMHVIFTDVEGNYPAFLQCMNRLIALCINELRDHTESVWSRAQAGILWLLDRDVRFDKLLYVLTNPVSAGLVERVADWPGAISLTETLHEKTVVAARPRTLETAEDYWPKTAELKVTRLPGFESDSPEEWKARVLEAVAEREAQMRERLRKEGRSVLGRKGVLAIDPFSGPTTTRKRREKRPPLYVSYDGSLRARARAFLRAFYEAYESARLAWKRHELMTHFPFGTYRNVLLGGFAATSPPFLA
jgi:REP element-mobilizing transposase RayT